MFGDGESARYGSFGFSYLTQAKIRKDGGELCSES